MLWSKRAIDGQRNRISFPTPKLSAILRATKVFPVPGGIISLPLSLDLKALKDALDSLFLIGS
jgi:hypothetical protein